MRQWMNPIIYTLIALAIFFIGIQLITNTSGFLTSMVMMIGMAALVYGGIYFLVLRKRGGSGNSNEMKKYKQAVRQSKQKNSSLPPTTGKKTDQNPNIPSGKASTMNKSKRKRKNAPNLRVIEGNKRKDKNRATF